MGWPGEGGDSVVSPQGAATGCRWGGWTRRRRSGGCGGGCSSSPGSGWKRCCPCGPTWYPGYSPPPPPTPPPWTTRCQLDCRTLGGHPEHHCVTLRSVPPPTLSAAMKWHRRAHLVALYCSVYPNFSLQRGAGAAASPCSRCGAVPSVTVLPAPVVTTPELRWLCPPPAPGCVTALGGHSPSCWVRVRRCSRMAAQRRYADPRLLGHGGCWREGTEACVSPPALPPHFPPLPRPGQGGQRGLGGYLMPT